MQAKSNYIPTLDGLRAVAIFTVILAHSIEAPTHTKVSGLGGIGVHIFFALSGYLITTRLLQEYAYSGDISLRNFYIRRVFRILPPAIFYLGIVWLLSMTRFVICNWRAIRASLFFYANYSHFGERGWRVAHFWSLSVEEHFYVFWPALLLIFDVRKGWRTAAAAALSIILWRILDDHFHLIAHLFRIPSLQQDLYRTDLVADVLFWGCCLAFYVRGPPRFSLSPLRSTALAVFAAAVLVSSIFWPIHHSAFVMHLFPAILLGAIVAAPSAPIGRFLELPVMRFFGRLSYSLYIWQQLFLGGPGPRLPLPFALAALLACAYFSYKVIEQPCIRFGHKLCRKPAPISPAPMKT
jgi:peptidoglycan/LPS O-acetylase OafA/YrhL